uniref:Uncharacterized protein n=1 Tax=Kalanchoe fedtschenkoi TaxID=63787 RepID=A0A7N0TZM4_KALFE
MEESALDCVLVPLGLAVMLIYHAWLLYAVLHTPQKTVIGLNADSRRQWVFSLMSDPLKNGVLMTRSSPVSDQLEQRRCRGCCSATAISADNHLDGCPSYLSARAKHAICVSVASASNTGMGKMVNRPSVHALGNVQNVEASATAVFAREKRRQQPGYGAQSRRRHQKTMAVNVASASASKAKKKKSDASGLGNVNTEKDPRNEHGSGSLAATADAQ